MRQFCLVGVKHIYKFTYEVLDHIYTWHFTGVTASGLVYASFFLPTNVL